MVKGKDGDFDAFGIISNDSLRNSVDCSDASSMMDIGFGAHLRVPNSVAKDNLEADTPEKLICMLQSLRA